MRTGEAVFFCLFTGACTTSLTNLNDPHALQVGEFEVTVAGQAQASSTPLVKGWQGGQALLASANAGPEPGEIPQKIIADPDLIEGALALALLAPSADPEFVVRAGLPSGPLPGLDMGLRLTPSVLKADLKGQLYESQDGRCAAALGIAYGYQFGGLYKDLEWLALTDFGRHDVDVMLSGGFRVPDIFEVYAGPRVLFSYITAKRKLEALAFDLLPSAAQKLDPSQLFRDESLIQSGLTAGTKLGYKYVFVRVEMSALYMWFRPTILGKARNFDGLVLSPSVALSGTW